MLLFPLYLMRQKTEYIHQIPVKRGYVEFAFVVIMDMHSHAGAWERVNVSPS